MPLCNGWTPWPEVDTDPAIQNTVFKAPTRVLRETSSSGHMFWMTDWLDMYWRSPTYETCMSVLVMSVKSNQMVARYEACGSFSAS